VVVEDRYARIFALEHARPARVADGLAELQVRWPSIPIVFCDTRKLAEEWTYRYLAAARVWAEAEHRALARIGLFGVGAPAGPAEPAPSTAEVRAWARAAGLTVPDRGRLRPEIHAAGGQHGTPTAADAPSQPILIFLCSATGVLPVAYHPCAR
jgi:hypothetical protein